MKSGIVHKTQLLANLWKSDNKIHNLIWNVNGQTKWTKVLKFRINNLATLISDAQALTIDIKKY